MHESMFIVAKIVAIVSAELKKDSESKFTHCYGTYEGPRFSCLDVGNFKHVYFKDRHQWCTARLVKG